MVVGITGHTSGIGGALAEYFTNNGDVVLGWSRSSGHDISVPESRIRIVQAAQTCDLVINNAYHDGSNSQFQLLVELWAALRGKSKILLNIGSRIGDHRFLEPTEYREHKTVQDNFCRDRTGLPLICNIRPGRINTDRIKHLGGKKMSTESVVDVVKFILTNKNKFWTNSVTISPI